MRNKKKNVSTSEHDREEVKYRKTFELIRHATNTHATCTGNHQRFVVQPVAPVAYQVILEPGIGHFREFESPRVCILVLIRGDFIAHKSTCGKRESVS